MNTFGNTSQTQGVPAKPVAMLPVKEPEHHKDQPNLQQPLPAQQHFSSQSQSMPQQQHPPLQQPSLHQQEQRLPSQQFQQQSSLHQQQPLASQQSLHQQQPLHQQQFQQPLHQQQQPLNQQQFQQQPLHQQQFQQQPLHQQQFQQQPLHQQQFQQQPLRQPGASGLPADLPADVSNAHVATSGVAWDVPVAENKHGVVSAQPIDNVHRVNDIMPSQFHQHDNNLASSGAAAGAGSQFGHHDRLQRDTHVPSAPAAVPISGATMHQNQSGDFHGHVGNRLFSYMETQGDGSSDGNMRWKDFKGYLEKSGWEQKKAEDSWYMFDTKKNGWLTRTDFLRFANEPSNRAYIQKIEADLPGGTGLAVGGIAGMTQQLKHTGLDPTSDIHDNSTAIEQAGAVYSSTLAAPAAADSEAKPKTATAFGDRISQFFNKGHIGNRLFTFLDEEDDKRGGVVTWGQLSLLLTQYGGWDVNQAQSAWWKIDDKHTQTMTRSEFVKFAELEESREHIQLIEADLTGKTGSGKFGKKIKQEDLQVDNATFTAPTGTTASTSAAGLQQPGTGLQQPGTLHQSAGILPSSSAALPSSSTHSSALPSSSSALPSTTHPSSQDPMLTGGRNQFNTGLSHQQQLGGPNTGLLNTDAGLQQQQSPFVPGKELPRE